MTSICRMCRSSGKIVNFSFRDLCNQEVPVLLAEISVLQVAMNFQEVALLKIQDEAPARIVTGIDNCDVNRGVSSKGTLIDTLREKGPLAPGLVLMSILTSAITIPPKVNLT